MRSWARAEDVRDEDKMMAAVVIEGIEELGFGDCGRLDWIGVSLGFERRKGEMGFGWSLVPKRVEDKRG